MYNYILLFKVWHRAWLSTGTLQSHSGKMSALAPLFFSRGVASRGGNDKERLRDNRCDELHCHVTAAQLQLLSSHLLPQYFFCWVRYVSDEIRKKLSWNGNLNCFGLSLSLRNENKLFLILKKKKTEDSSRPSTHGLTRFPHNIRMLKAIFRKGPFLQTSILWSNDVWKLSHCLKG